MSISIDRGGRVDLQSPLMRSCIRLMSSRFQKHHLKRNLRFWCWGLRFRVVAEPLARHLISTQCQHLVCFFRSVVPTSQQLCATENMDSHGSGVRV